MFIFKQQTWNPSISLLICYFDEPLDWRDVFILLTILTLTTGFIEKNEKHL